ncbi:uncharacterized protein N0V89_007620 [Didymosphaeria variabile]|uniref:Uncharacterized protein n=1 Tax=Didymosphaeria variabile TaxID=1932322 RepID=A0A9W8XJ66_9PLEO|nr:uncharacterized protein N0V89_007620 [Didymosphaeria variabile]KAJ4352273.1 hypothetical protein N0V89_007620 [Didymosphaeria variabile]
MRKRQGTVTYPAGRIDWTPYLGNHAKLPGGTDGVDGRSDDMKAADASRADDVDDKKAAGASRNVAEAGTEPARKAGSAASRCSWCHFAAGALLVIAGVFAVWVGRPHRSLESGQPLSKIPFTLAKPEPLEQLARTLKQCAVIGSDVEAFAEVTTLSNNVLHGEESLRNFLHDRVGRAGERARAYPESCQRVDEFWNVLNATRVTIDNVGANSKALLEAVAKVGRVIDDDWDKEKAECKKYIHTGRRPFKKTLVAKFGNRENVVKFWTDKTEDEMKEKCSDRLTTLEICSETQSQLSAMAYDHSSRLKILSIQAAKWSRYPQRWITEMPSREATCAAKDEAGGVEGLWATIGVDAMAALSWDA